MARIAVLSDTHVPSRAGEIPTWVESAVREADHAVHAGDFDSPSAYDRVYELADGDLTAVAGNMDPRSLGVDRVETLDVEGVRLVVTHGHGHLNYLDGVVETVEQRDGDVGVAGHTHELTDETHRGVRVLNPGSATAAAPAHRASMMTLTVEDGDLDVEVEKR